MAEHTCSHCGQPGRRLESVSTTAWIDYYRCGTCAQVWSVGRDAKTPAVKVVSSRRSGIGSGYDGGLPWLWPRTTRTPKRRLRLTAQSVGNRYALTPTEPR